MQCGGILSDEVTYVCMLKACAAIGAIGKGKEVCDKIWRQGLLEHHIVLGNALVHMYAKCGALRQAQSVLNKLPSHDIVSWNALIARRHCVLECSTCTHTYTITSTHYYTCVHTHINTDPCPHSSYCFSHFFRATLAPSEEDMAQQRKRGRFSYDEPEPEESHSEKKVRFPKGKKESQSLQKIFEGEQVDYSIKSTDPRVAATERAGRRSSALDRHEETSIPADVYGAEEEYQESEEEDEVEAAMEPFNLKQEREEGYFDADGNYVEYINQNVKDAWLDSAEVDTSLAAKHLKRYAEEEVELTLSAKDLAAIKRRIADALRPGETVLKALRRLKSTSTEKDRHLRAKMSNHIQETFDMLTDDAMKLLDNGEYNVYNEEKETFEREAEGYESLEKAKLRASTLSSQGEGSTSGGVVGSVLENTSLFEQEQLNGTGEEAKISNDKASLAIGNSTDASMDMFADDDNEVARDSSSNQGEDHPGDPGYVYDEGSGYYYNSSLGYYYDGNTGLFCNAASGMWFKFDDKSGSYTEVVEDLAEQ